jgi:hypothetical protein
MRDEDLKASLATVEGDTPSSEFLASLIAEVEAESDRTLGGDSGLPLYSSDGVDVDEVSVWPTVSPNPGAARRWVGAGIAVAAAALVVIVGLAVIDSGDNGTQVATSRLPHGYATSVLPAAIIQGGDGDVVLAGDASAGLDPVVAPWYRQERSTFDDQGFVAGLTVPFDLEVPGTERSCSDQLRDAGGRGESGTGLLLPCGGSSAALLFGDDVAAVRALDALVTHLETHTGGIYRLGVLLERTRDLEAEFGDEAEAFVLSEFVDAREAAEVVVIAWRTDNLVQLLWDIQGRGTPGGVEALMDTAEHIERRTEAQRQSGGD